MTDLFIRTDGDLELLAGDLALDRGLASAVLVSLFSDARVPLEDSPDGTERGWWGEEAGDPFGSRLWALARERELPAALPRFEAAAQDALAWLLEDDIASRVDVTASFPARGVVQLVARIARGDARRWAHVWRSVRNQRSVREPFTLDLIFDDA